jgi:biotin operon repressor
MLVAPNDFQHWDEGSAVTLPDILPLTEGHLNIFLYEAALKDDKIPSTEKSVLRLIIFRCNGDDYTCYFAQEKAAKQLGITRTRLSRAVSWLRKNGYIETRPKGRILTFDLCSWGTRCYDLSLKSTVLCSTSTAKCAPRAHRTSLELATKTLLDSRNGMKYKITAEGSREYIFDAN